MSKQARSERRTSHRAPVLVAVAISVALGSPGAEAQAESGGDLNKIYPKTPYSTAIMGYFATGMALTDIDGDGRIDMVTANGNDMSPQQLTVHPGLEGSPYVSPRPQWVSRESQYMMRIAVGDINNDGWKDVAVALPFDIARNIGAGGVQVFVNRGGTLEPYASYRTGGGYSSTGCALADIDADGDLDLVVAVSLEGAGRWPPEEGQVLNEGRARIYLNQDGELDTTPAWISDTRLGALQVLAADIDQDGWMDLAFGGKRVSVFYGSAPTAGRRVPFHPRPSWTSDEVYPYIFSIDAGFPGKVTDSKDSQAPSKTKLMLVVSTGCLTSTASRTVERSREGHSRSKKPKVFFPFWPNLPIRPIPLVPPPPVSPDSESACSSRFVIYEPTRQDGPVWQSQEAKLASVVRLADLDNDGILDLIGNQWGPINVDGGTVFPGAPLWMFQGTRHGFGPRPQFVSKVKRVGGGLALQDLKSPQPEPKIHRFEALKEISVVTLPRRIVEVVGVKRQERHLSVGQYAWQVGSNAVSLNRPLRGGEVVKVSYTSPVSLDIAEAIWNPQDGNGIYFSYLSEEP